MSLIFVLKREIINKFKDKKIRQLVFIPLVSAVVGSVITLIFAPVYQQIEFSYWNKKFEKETNRYLVEKRIETVQEFRIANSEVNYCFDKTTANARTSNDPNSFLLALHCRKELDVLWNVGFKANVYFDEQTNKELQNLNTLVSALLFKTALSPFRTEEYQKQVNESSDKILELMQINLFNFEQRTHFLRGFGS